MAWIDAVICETCAYLSHWKPWRVIDGVWTCTGCGRPPGARAIKEMQKREDAAR